MKTLALARRPTIRPRAVAPARAGAVGPLPPPRLPPPRITRPLAVAVARPVLAIVDDEESVASVVQLTAGVAPEPQTSAPFWNQRRTLSVLAAALALFGLAAMVGHELGSQRSVAVSTARTTGAAVVLTSEPQPAAPAPPAKPVVPVFDVNSLPSAPASLSH